MAKIFTPAAVPDTTLPFYPGLARTIGVHWFETLPPMAVLPFQASTDSNLPCTIGAHLTWCVFVENSLSKTHNEQNEDKIKR